MNLQFVPVTVVHSELPSLFEAISIVLQRCPASIFSFNFVVDEMVASALRCSQDFGIEMANDEGFAT